MRDKEQGSFVNIHYVLKQPKDLSLNRYIKHCCGFIGNYQLRLKHNYTHNRNALCLPAADFLESACREFPSRTMTTISTGFLARAIPLLQRNGQEQLAQELYRRLTDKLPAPSRKPSLDEVLQGWNPHYPAAAPPDAT